MFFKKLLIILLFCPFLLRGQSYNTAKPWAYWWWLGSAVDEQGITKNLEDFAKAGFGGLHIIPIYGVKGEEAKFIPYLSPKWVEMLEHTVKEANRLGLGIDMTVGTGWPFGGNQVTNADAAKSFKIKQDESGKYNLEVLQTKQKVKRAAPGAEGWVVDHFDSAALKRYFQPFDALFSKKNIGVRAFYNDSYEAYGANWTTEFFKKFKLLRGYDLAEHLDVLAQDTAKTEREKRIWADYHETLSDLLYEGFTKEFVNFSKKYGKMTRNESHGSPANVLDLYALNDSPETEFFGSKPYKIPLYRQDPDYQIDRFGVPGDLVLKLASSAAHVAGKRFVSSETATWLGNHFKVSLSQIKPIVDESFLGGVNHIFYHGIPYSPPNEPFPGWLFYASTNFNQQSHFWNTLPELNAYIERCQNLLQNSQPDNDVLVYFPIHDLWHSVGRNAKLHMLDVHAIIRQGMFNSPFGRLAQQLKQDGYSFDFVSDRQILASKTIDNQLITGGGRKYRVIVVPPIEYMPLETLRALEKRQNEGVLVVFMEKLPRTVNGFKDVEKREQAFKGTLRRFVPYKNGYAQVFDNHQIRKEKLVEAGLLFLRKKTSTGWLYFIANQDQKFKKDSIELSVTVENVMIFNPLYNTKQFIDFKKIAKDRIRIPLSMASGESVFIETFDKPIQTKVQIPKFVIRKPQSETVLRGAWKVTFLKGAPSLPQDFTTEKLDSWTVLSNDTASQYFSGTARYTLSFNCLDTQVGKAGWLELGDVRETATVKLNGKTLGTAWCLPFRVPITEGVLLKENNQLDIEVTNLSANRVRYLDKKGVQWRKFYDINFVDITYNPFDASQWQPVPSGLLGEVKLMTF
ncbi:MAG: hypothetical protein JNL70_02935 [Saprospiraceae bacterium]|nr:hypothetical protein [Saprospiraceae bacterium]